MGRGDCAIMDGLVPALLVLGLAGFVGGCRCPASTTPDGVVKSALKVNLTGRETTVDFYLPSGVKQAPVVVVAHGFSRSRRNMAGWGELLAAHGFITAIPDLPASADHDRNGLAIRELLFHSGPRPIRPPRCRWYRCPHPG